MDHLRVMLFGLDKRARARNVSQHVLNFIVDLATADKVDTYLETNGRLNEYVFAKAGFDVRIRAPITCRGLESELAP